MKVYLATNHCSGDYGSWFPDAKVIEHEDNMTDDVDLLILSGGSDISPKRYNEKNTHSYGLDLERDERELNIMRRTLLRSKNPKIFGICRGAQLLNVFFGGDLYQDLGVYGIQHPAVHALEHTARHPLDWMNYSNSMHHQAIHHIGNSGDILAIEPVSRVAEIVQWSNMALAVQFHPEIFLPDMGDKFFSVIEDWVNGKVSFDQKGDDNE